MKVLHICNAVGRYNAGGIGAVLTAFISSQNELVDYIEVWHPNSQEDSVEFSQTTNLCVDQIKSFKTIGSDKIGFSSQLLLSAQKRKNDFDIIHQHGIWLPISIASLLFDSKKTKKIISPHGFLNRHALTISKNKKIIAGLLYENKNLKTATCLHACSDFEASFFRDYGLQQDIALIPNGVDDEFLNAQGNPKAFKNKHGITDEKILLFLSRIHPSKGIELLLRVIESLKTDFTNWKLIIAGIDELNHEEELKSLTKELKIEHIVKFIGPVFDQEKVDAFDASDIFILPTDTENFGIVVAQALARKKAVITTREAPWKDLEDYDCGWWIPKTEVALKNVISKVLRLSTEELQQKGMNGFNLVKKKYLWSQLTNRTIELYDFLLNPSVGKPKFIL